MSNSMTSINANDRLNTSSSRTSITATTTSQQQQQQQQQQRRNSISTEEQHRLEEEEKANAELAESIRQLERKLSMIPPPSRHQLAAEEAMIAAPLVATLSGHKSPVVTRARNIRQKTLTQAFFRARLRWKNAVNAVIEQHKVEHERLRQTRDDTKMAFIRSHFLFKQLAPERQSTLKTWLREKHLARGAVLFQQGDYPWSVFFIQSGSVVVRTRVPMSAAEERRRERARQLLDEEEEKQRRADEAALAEKEVELRRKKRLERQRREVALAEAEAQRAENQSLLIRNGGSGKGGAPPSTEMLELSIPGIDNDEKSESRAERVAAITSRLAGGQHRGWHARKMRIRYRSQRERQARIDYQMAQQEAIAALKGHTEYGFAGAIAAAVAAAGGSQAAAVKPAFQHPRSSSAIVHAIIKQRDQQRQVDAAMDAQEKRTKTTGHKRNQSMDQHSENGSDDKGSVASGGNGAKHIRNSSMQFLSGDFSALAASAASGDGSGLPSDELDPSTIASLRIMDRSPRKNVHGATRVHEHFHSVPAAAPVLRARARVQRRASKRGAAAEAMRPATTSPMLPLNERPKWNSNRTRSMITPRLTMAQKQAAEAEQAATARKQQRDADRERERLAEQLEREADGDFDPLDDDEDRAVRGGRKLALTDAQRAQRSLVKDSKKMIDYRLRPHNANASTHIRDEHLMLGKGSAAHAEFRAQRKMGEVSHHNSHVARTRYAVDVGMGVTSTDGWLSVDVAVVDHHGGWCGEEEMVSMRLRECTCVAREPTVVYELKRAHFRELIRGPLLRTVAAMVHPKDELRKQRVAQMRRAHEQRVHRDVIPHSRLQLTDLAVRAALRSATIAAAAEASKPLSHKNDNDTNDPQLKALTMAATARTTGDGTNNRLMLTHALQTIVHLGDGAHARSLGVINGKMIWGSDPATTPRPPHEFNNDEIDEDANDDHQPINQRPSAASSSSSTAIVKWSDPSKGDGIDAPTRRYDSLVNTDFVFGPTPPLLSTPMASPRIPDSNTALHSVAPGPVATNIDTLDDDDHHDENDLSNLDIHSQPPPPHPTRSTSVSFDPSSSPNTTTPSPPLASPIPMTPDSPTRAAMRAIESGRAGWRISRQRPQSAFVRAPVPPSVVPSQPPQQQPTPPPAPTTTPTTTTVAPTARPQSAHARVISDSSSSTSSQQQPTSARLSATNIIAAQAPSAWVRPYSSSTASNNLNLNRRTHVWREQLIGSRPTSAITATVVPPSVTATTSLTTPRSVVPTPSSIASSVTPRHQQSQPSPRPSSIPTQRTVPPSSSQSVGSEIEIREENWDDDDDDGRPLDDNGRRRQHHNHDNDDGHENDLNDRPTPLPSRPHTAVPRLSLPTNDSFDNSYDEPLRRPESAPVRPMDMSASSMTITDEPHFYGSTARSSVSSRPLSATAVAASLSLLAHNVVAGSSGSSTRGTSPRPDSRTGMPPPSAPSSHNVSQSLSTNRPPVPTANGRPKSAVPSKHQRAVSAAATASGTSSTEFSRTSRNIRMFHSHGNYTSQVANVKQMAINDGSSSSFVHRRAQTTLTQSSHGSTNKNDDDDTTTAAATNGRHTKDTLRGAEYIRHMLQQRIDRAAQLAQLSMIGHNDDEKENGLISPPLSSRSMQTNEHNNNDTSGGEWVKVSNGMGLNVRPPVVKRGPGPGRFVFAASSSSRPQSATTGGASASLSTRQLQRRDSIAMADPFIESTTPKADGDNGEEEAKEEKNHAVDSFTPISPVDPSPLPVYRVPALTRPSPPSSATPILPQSLSASASSSTVTVPIVTTAAAATNASVVVARKPVTPSPQLRSLLRQLKEFAVPAQ
jgi:CRP-like cAMP-binding protein